MRMQPPQGEQEPAEAVFRMIWASWILIRNLFVRVLESTSQKRRKTLISFWLLHDFLSLKNDVHVNVPSRRNKHKNLRKKVFLGGALKVTRKEQEPDPEQDPIVKRIRSRIRIHTKMSRIRNTAKKPKKFHYMTCLSPQLRFTLTGSVRRRLSDPDVPYPDPESNWIWIQWILTRA